MHEDVSFLCFFLFVFVVQGNVFVWVSVLFFYVTVGGGFVCVCCGVSICLQVFPSLQLKSGNTVSQKLSPSFNSLVTIT